MSPPGIELATLGFLAADTYTAWPSGWLFTCVQNTCYTVSDR